MQTQTANAASLPNPPGYPIGTILHGTNPRIGNLWIITVDQSYEASLLYDGKANFVCADALYKRDRMSPNMRIADANDITRMLGAWSKLPTWATPLMFISSKPLPTSARNLPLNSPAISSILKTLGTPQAKLKELGLTKKAPDLVLCTARDVSGPHEFKPYYGFTDNYEYCKFCDLKRNLPDYRGDY